MTVDFSQQGTVEFRQTLITTQDKQGASRPASFASGDASAENKDMVFNRTRDENLTEKQELDRYGVVGICSVEDVNSCDDPFDRPFFNHVTVAACPEEALYNVSKMVISELLKDIPEDSEYCRSANVVSFYCATVFSYLGEESHTFENMVFCHKIDSYL